MDALKIPATIVTPEEDPTALLFEPALSRSVIYKRAVGYFTSGWIARNAVGLARLAASGGRAKWVTSPHLTESDWRALRQGIEGIEAVLERATFESIVDLATALTEDTLNTISWLVADGILEFRIAMPRDRFQESDFHSKIGVFCDEQGPGIAFIGSMNETARGFRNHEIISTFARSRGELDRVEKLDALFEKIWAGEDEHYATYSLSKAAREEIIKFARGERPYSRPTSSKLTSNRALLRPYQLEAVTSWQTNGRKGILEMATGTGKTKTALACIESILADSESSWLVIVACPFQHLVDQWADELELMEIETVRAHGDSSKWRPHASRMINRLLDGGQNAGFLVTTYATLGSDHLQFAVEPIADKVMFIADECHYLGAKQAKSGMNPAYPIRLGLSATPSRHYDEGGTADILNYFEGIVFEYAMEQAIANGYLVPYYYVPEFVELSSDESQQFASLSEQISRLANYRDAKAQERMKRLAIRRARILNNAEAKLDWLQDHMSRNPADSWEYTLVYSGDAIFPKTTELIGRTLGIRQHEFTSRQSRSQRRNILARFEDRDLQVLCAMKCLDEGVDVPPTRTAYFLASSGNPREFVQRRGRILRPSPGKEHAQIYDAVAVPQMNSVFDADMHKATRAALRTQLRRVQEFSRLANNRIQAEDALFDFRLRYDLPLAGEEEESDVQS